jgi:hypothetical protein
MVYETHVRLTQIKLFNLGNNVPLICCLNFVIRLEIDSLQAGSPGPGPAGESV